MEGSEPQPLHRGRRGDDEVMANGTDPGLGGTRTLSRTTECVGLIREPSHGSHQGQRPCAPHQQAGHMTAPDPCAAPTITLAVRGPFSNRGFHVNGFALRTAVPRPGVTVLFAIGATAAASSAPGELGCPRSTTR